MYTRYPATVVVCLPAAITANNAAHILHDVDGDDDFFFLSVFRLGRNTATFLMR